MVAEIQDEELMARIANGDEEAFRLLVDRWQNPVRNFIWRMTGSEEDARDLCQESFVKVFKEASRYRSENMFKSWLFRIAGNSARSLLRRRRIIGWVQFDSRKHDRPAEAAGPAENLERSETRSAVRAAVMKLPVRQREAVLLSRFHEMSRKDVAAAMGATTAAVESLLQRAAGTLRQELAREVTRK